MERNRGPPTWKIEATTEAAVGKTAAIFISKEFLT